MYTDGKPAPYMRSPRTLRGKTWIINVTDTPIPEKRTNGTRNVSPRKRGGLITINVYSILSGTTRPKIYLKQPKFISKLKTRSEENCLKGHCQDGRMEPRSCTGHTCGCVIPHISGGHRDGMDWKRVYRSQVKC